ncbi:Hypothetical predicted protein [Lecanosticta acicola]|uniref:Uncharacterized protein n=1 Tax=Lecanosticta acicola TaxID=111012 RepID=A0AAI8YS12_9PEZI|nr:Hypothetical predicted protein [Lecanosticta acicola]
MANSKVHEGRRALADSQHSSISAEMGTSSDDERDDIQGAQEDDVRNAIGVSIGRGQSRLLDSTTPVVEKNAAIDQTGGFFGTSLESSLSVAAADGTDESGGEDRETTDGDKRRQGRFFNNIEQPRDLSGLPSPWRVDQRQLGRSKGTMSILRDGFSFGRKRASSGPESTPESGGQKSLLASFTMPRNFALGSSSTSARENDKEEDRPPLSDDVSSRHSTFGDRTQSSSPAKTIRSPTPYGHRSRQPSGTNSPWEYEEAQATVADLPRELRLQHAQSRPEPPLRRSTSDTSLVTQRTLSRVSSLGDDSRFENVQEQVNSRFKAIKDSLQDSSIRLPSMPSISSFNVTRFGSDFLNRERSGSLGLKPPANNSHNGSPNRSMHSERPVDPMTRQPYASAKAAISDAGVDKPYSEHVHFNEALDNLEGDIVILGGYRGSVLRSAEPPHRQLWVPIKVGLNLRKVDLEVGFGEDDDERASEKVIAGGMLTHIGPVDISRRLLKRLRTCENARSGRLRVHEYGYDWRLHPHYLSKQLISFLESLPSNSRGTPGGNRGATVIAHSLGGLITRHAVNQRPELFNGVVYAGVPKTCVNILGPFRNGDEVLLSSRVLTAQVNFSIRTSFALLPLNGRCFFDKTTREEYPVDFFDPQTWIDYRLSPCIARPLPPLTAPPKPSGITGYVSSMASALPSLPLRNRKASVNRNKNSEPSHATVFGGVEAPDTPDDGAEAMTLGNYTTPGRQQLDVDGDADTDTPSPRTAVTISRGEALEYLTRTLRTVKQFKEELAFRPEHHSTNVYPPISVIYGKSTPTVFGAKVDGREGIKHVGAYDELAFASGDGVVLAKAAMVPDGYRTVRGGIVSSERGHVTLLGDLEAVGRCLNAVRRARRQGVGYVN